MKGAKRFPKAMDRCGQKFLFPLFFVHRRVLLRLSYSCRQNRVDNGLIGKCTCRQECSDEETRVVGGDALKRTTGQEDESVQMQVNK